MRALRTVIVDDEPLARDLLRSYIALHDDLDLVGEAESGVQGKTLIEELQPDLVLLDIQMPGLSGLSLARDLTYGPAIIFVTALDAHAIAAFELGAFDYLLKPVTRDRFAAALGRVRERFASQLQPSSEIATASRLEVVTKSGLLERFFVRRSGAVVLIHVADVIRFESDDDYTAVFVRGQRHLVHIALRDLMPRLDPSRFVRVHRSHVLNLAYVDSSVVVNRRLRLQMKDGSIVEASRAGTQAVRSYFI